MTANPTILLGFMTDETETWECQTNRQTDRQTNDIFKGTNCPMAPQRKGPTLGIKLILSAAV